MDAHEVVTELWAGLDGQEEMLDRLTVTGPTHVLPSVFPVTAAATGAVAAATLAAADLWCRRGAAPSSVAVDTRHATLACRSERFLQALDKPLGGGLWDPIAGTYATADGWIRLHTNHRKHRRAALTVLGFDHEQGGEDRRKVGQRVARWGAVDLEDAIYDAGGCAGALRGRDRWRSMPDAALLARTPLVETQPLGPDGASRTQSPATIAGTPPRPLSGMRVLDLTRVIAGPVAGRFLAAHGADVLRIDAPSGEDGAVVVADTTVGKRSALLDLTVDADRAAFEGLVATADVVLCAYRPGALAGLGYAPADLARIRPGLVVACLSAYGGAGQEGTWGPRRGFDSLVQMVTGLADEGRRLVGGDIPVPLPAQVLDHASGYLLAAGTLTALGRRVAAGDGAPGCEVRTSLARTAQWLDDLGRSGASDLTDPPDDPPEDLTVDLHGPLGRTRHITCPGVIVGAAPQWRSGPVPLGFDPPAWQDASI